MALIEIPDPLTTAGKKVIVNKQIRENVARSFGRLVVDSNMITRMVFANAYGLTPQEVCDALGSDAAQLVGLAGAVATMVNGVAPGTMTTTPPKTLEGKDQVITTNQNGTVTIEIVG